MERVDKALCRGRIWFHRVHKAAVHAGLMDQLSAGNFGYALEPHFGSPLLTLTLKNPAPQPYTLNPKP